MNVLLLRPVPANERFGLGPFFRIEPLGMEYIAAALEARGHRVTLADLRFSRSLAAQIRAARPALVGIAAMHALETDEVLALARRVRALSPDVPIVDRRPHRGGLPRAVSRAGDGRGRGRRRRARAAAGLRRARTRRAADDGAGARAARRRRRRRPHGRRDRHAGARRGAAAGASSRRRRGAGSTPAWRIARRGWSRPRAAARSAARSARSGSCTRARCASDRSTRSAATSRRSATTSSSPTICSGTIRRAAWSWRASCGGAASASSGFWCRAGSIWWRATPDLLEAWRPLAKDFDIFFGLEAATDEGLDGLTKDATVDETARGVEVARQHRLRRDRQLRHRSGMDRSRTSSGSGRSSSGIACFRPASRS